MSNLPAGAGPLPIGRTPDYPKLPLPTASAAMTRMAFPVRRGIAALALLGSLGCGGDLTLPDVTGAGIQLRAVSGEVQGGMVGQPLPSPLVVAVTSESGLPISGRKVAFVLSADSATGHLEPDTAVTNSSGEASSRWVLGSAPGEYAAEARLVATAEEVPTVQFRASAVPAEPDTIRADSRVSQPGFRAEPLPDPLVVQVVDRFGNPVPGAAVEWAVTVGEGTVSESATTAGADGRASVSWTLGDRIGVQRVTARIGEISGSPVTFSATVLF